MRTLGWLVACGLGVAACGGGGAVVAPTAATPSADAEADLLVWRANPDETLWVRGGRVLARRAEVVVASGGALWALRFAPRTVYDHGGCVDGCDASCMEAMEHPERDPPPPPPPEEHVIRDLVAAPLAGGSARVLATQTTQDDVSCGIAGREPELVGGVDGRVSVVWAEGTTTSAVVSEEGGPEGAVFDVATGARVPLTAPAGFEAAMGERLRAPCDVETPDGSDTACAEGSVIAGPVALRVSLWSLGAEPSVDLTAVATWDGWGTSGDATADIPVDDTLGLGPVPAELMAIGAATWPDASGVPFGFSRVGGAVAERDALRAGFERPAPEGPAGATPHDRPTD